MRIALLAAPLLTAGLLVGCSRSAPEPAPEPAPPAPTWTAVAEDDLAPGQQNQLDRALAARDAMMGRLMGRLSEVLTAEGPAAAIVVCQGEAPQIAQAIATEHGVAIGRTSFKLRHPANQPPAWAATLVEQRVEEPAYLAHPDGRLAALLPIRAKKKCLTCHGGEAEIPGAVREKLEELYPQDQATGFAEGDLRGWFWIEAPPAST